MRRRRFLVPLAIGAVAVLAACNAIVGLSGDYDLASNDASVPTADAHLPDATPVTDANSGQPDSTTAIDTGIADSGPPGDACPADIEPTIDAAPIPSETFTPTICPGTLPAGEIICWDFSGSQDATSKFGWNELLLTAGATLDVEGALSSAQRNLHALVTDAAGPPPLNAGLWFTDWDSKDTPNYIDPLRLPQGSTITAHFHFQVLQANTPMVVGGWRINGAVFGVGVYPTPCGGRPRVGSSVAPPTATTGGGFIDLATWYYGSVAVTRNADDSYTGSVSVGSQALSDGGTGISSGGDVLDGSFVPVGIGVGLFNGVTNEGATQVIVDEVTGDQQ